MTDTDWSEHYIKRDDPSKPTYYIIRSVGESNGIILALIVFAGHIRYALSKGWLPVIDMQNYPNAYLAPEKLGQENSWEYYFEQPLRIGLEQAYNGKNVILGAQKIIAPCPNDGVSFFENQNNVLVEWRMLRKLGLLKIKPQLLEEIYATRKKLFAPNDRVLGVHLRGTDYVSSKPTNHPIPPPLELAVSTVIAKLNEWDCNKIFLATEDKNIVQNFKEIFGDFCVTFDREYVDFNPGQAVGIVRIDRENDYFLQGKEYLMEMAILSMCNSFVTARCSGSVGVMILAEDFENVFAFNLGRYGVIGLD